MYITGLVYHYKGSATIATETWKKGNELDPDDQRCREAVKLLKQQEKLKEEATVLFKAGNYKDAAIKYEEGAKLDEFNTKWNSVLYSNIGTCYVKQGDHKTAIKHFNTAIKCNPKYAAAYHKRGTSHKVLEK
jgi:tetratricopeptide (TPR) repeat protein